VRGGTRINEEEAAKKKRSTKDVTLRKDSRYKEGGSYFSAAQKSIQKTRKGSCKTEKKKASLQGNYRVMGRRMSRQSRISLTKRGGTENSAFWGQVGAGYSIFFRMESNEGVGEATIKSGREELKKGAGDSYSPTRASSFRESSKQGGGIWPIAEKNV